MAKQRRGGQRKPKPTKRRSSKKVDKQLVSDRVTYLKSIANPSVTFRTKADAEKFARDVYRDTGAKYKVSGKTAKLQSVTRDAVSKSRDFGSIKKDLKSRSKSARGKKAKALEQLGRRESFWNWSVGETNE